MNLTIKKYIFLCSFSLGSLSPSLCLAIEGSQNRNSRVSYQEIGDLYLPSHSSIEVLQDAIAENFDMNFQKNDEKKKLNLEIPLLDEQEKRAYLFSILHKQYPEGFSDESDVLFQNGLLTLLKDLDVYSCQGESRSNTLMKKLDNTVSVFGEIGLIKMLANPTRDVSILHARQALIKELIENDALYEKVDALMHQLKDAENGFFSFWCEDDPVSADYFNSLYYNKNALKNMNSSSLALEGLVRLRNLGTVWKTWGDVALFTGVNYLLGKTGEALAQKYGNEVKPYSMKDAVISTGKQIYGALNPLEYKKEYIEIGTIESKLVDPQGSPILMPDGKPISESQIKNIKNASYAVLILKGLLAPAYVAKYIVTTKAAVEQALQAKNAINYLQTRLIDVAHVVSIFKAVESLAYQSNIFSQALPDTSVVSGSNDYDQLILDLQTNTFKGSASFFSYSGRVLSSYKRMNSCKDEFAAIIEYLGQLDACLSFAKLYKKFENERVRYSFAQYEESQDTPHIALNELWNPFVDYAVVVTNDFCVGKDTPNNIILTGSNTGGKSTILKAILINLLLAHTFGIVACKSAQLTPLSYLGSYLRVNDDIGAGDSLFKAEVLRAQCLVDTLSSLKGDSFGFAVIDELFTGTSAAKGENAAYKIAQRLLEYPNASFILATHFPLLTQLEEESPEICCNYCIDVYKDKTGNLIRPYKMVRGISLNNVADDILRMEFQDMNFDF